MTIVLLELIFTSMLTGLIWTIQLINYPQLAMVGPLEYSQFHQFHIRAITPLVGPLMVAELCLCFLNLYQSNVPRSVSWWSLAALVFIWGTTVFFSVPLHEKMVTAKNELLIHQLVLSNWVRTIAWSFKCGLLSWVVLKKIQ